MRILTSARIARPTEATRFYGPEVFFGYHPRTLDSKWRVVIPSKWRQQLGANFRLVIIQREQSKDPKMIYLYPQTAWEALRQTIGNFNEIKTFYSSTFELEFDTNGRVVIPQEVIAAVGFSSAQQLLVKGCGDHLEISKQTQPPAFTPIISPPTSPQGKQL
ncbi:hypothetical protein A3H38_03005 [candidate division WOR-1 bacterium RIFCSPLOWO2_02_FULL_46_20]|uniref:Transcriptional regulator MraZ n=2 Tax=Saganbacteria TaxID=1703751 RepID=A0A1F4R8W4_UNCSA|nr:MAG: hypothetical protein A3J44_00760 [candidate division WOR-1 bacterium RIFCSPHIGHO2_02_FULL_45_12]OGC04612.1 MAG: hypothetical protein A3H38_03005 [candidate division WOR-1 bacterium RIFCSPLOWO2_02_FULL_46_20]OGC08861.1 MAG: hypothetical protein A3F86_00245 [candidate division WOR-1 bacterium RIFCSPLOWO2_12_FULL_45_9]